jgi:hypothetical protein
MASEVSLSVKQSLVLMARHFVSLALKSGPIVLRAYKLAACSELRSTSARP